MDKITMSEAKKMCRHRIGSPHFYLQHIEWFNPSTGYSIIYGADLQAENPDCTHAVIDGNKRYNAPNAVVALVLEEQDGGES